MPCGLCNTWIDGEWIDWRECYAQPTEDNRILVHTSSLPAFDTPCVVHLVSVTSHPSWYFFCQACRMNLRTIRAGFLGQQGNPAGCMESEIRLRRVMVPPDDPWNAQYWPVFIRIERYTLQSSDSDSSSPSSWDIQIQSPQIQSPRIQSPRIQSPPVFS